jgi:hypothetical protein
MACNDCDQGRRNSAYRVFSLGCIFCGARYARAVRTATDVQFPARVGDAQLSRRQWHDHVLKSWADFGHDPERLKTLAAADKVPFEPVER